MEEQVKAGIRVQKEWLATQDGRTRHSHALLDGERVDVDKKFSNGLMYPGDPEGAAEEVYNCRCTLVYFYPDFQKDLAKTTRESNAYQATENEQAFKEVKLSANTETVSRGGKTFEVNKVLGVENEMYIAQNVEVSRKLVHDVDRSITKALKKVANGNTTNAPQTIIVSNREMQKAAVATYSAIKNTILILEDIIDPVKRQELQKGFYAPNKKDSTIMHEMVHWATAQEYVKKYGAIDTQAKYEAYKRWANKKAEKKLAKLKKEGYSINVSQYAENSYKIGNFDEAFTEFMVKEMFE